MASCAAFSPAAVSVSSSDSPNIERRVESNSPSDVSFGGSGALFSVKETPGFRENAGAVSLRLFFGASETAADTTGRTVVFTTEGSSFSTSAMEVLKSSFGIADGAVSGAGCGFLRAAVFRFAEDPPVRRFGTEKTGF